MRVEAFEEDTTYAMLDGGVSDDNTVTLTLDATESAEKFYPES